VLLNEALGVLKPVTVSLLEDLAASHADEVGRELAYS
jgi:hypothetical protein